MSAFVVDKRDITYMVQAVADWRVFVPMMNDGARNTIMTREERESTGQTLWSENVKSVEHRYPDIDGDLPGTVGDAPYDYVESEGWHWHHLDPVAVIKCCRCWRYQSCEHLDYREWPENEAFQIVDALESAAIERLPGYDEAQWGAPEPTGTGIRRLSDMFAR